MPRVFYVSFRLFCYVLKKLDIYIEVLQSGACIEEVIGRSGLLVLRSFEGPYIFGLIAL